MFEHLIGNPLAKEYLKRLLEQQKIPHALLFAGPSGVGKSAFAKAFAGALIGLQGGQPHPDLHEYYPEGKIGAHSMETMRSFSDEVSLAPYHSPWKVFIIHEAERMLKYSANALLKTFEEPTPRTAIILVSSAPEMLLPTILSRCRTIPFRLIAHEEIEGWIREKYSLDGADAKAFAKASKGSLQAACLLAEQGGRLFEKYLAPILEKGGFSSYSELMRTAKELAEAIDALKGEEQPAQEGELTALQQNQLDKEKAGVGAVKYFQQTASLLEQLAAWYRDMQLLFFKGETGALWHEGHKDSLLRSLQCGYYRELDLVLASVQEALSSIQRSTPLQNALETLFLRIKLL